MFAKTETPLKPGLESLLAKESRSREPYAQGSLRIEGSAEGNVECEGDVTVSETAVLNADDGSERDNRWTSPGTVTCPADLAPAHARGEG